MSTLSILLTALVIASPPATPMSQVASAPDPVAPLACETAVAQIVAGEARVRVLQAQLSGSVQNVEQNSRNGQAVGQAGRALGWATAVASFVPGVGFAASAAGAAVTHQAIEAQQRATAATNQTLQEVVSELAPLGQRLHNLRQAAAAQGCDLPPPPAP